jgi:hypothetical protein
MGSVPVTTTETWRALAEMDAESLLAAMLYLLNFLASIVFHILNVIWVYGEDNEACV